MANANNKPVQVYRSGPVSASVFQNQAKSDGGATTFYKVALSRTYKDGDEFKTTTSLGRDDLPAASLLLQQAWQYIVEAEQSTPSKE